MTARCSRSGMLFGMLLCLALPSITDAATYYVAPNGADGAAGSSGLPWRTITYAARRVQAGDTVVVRPGVYREAVIVKRSGRFNQPITFLGLPGAVLESPDPSRSLSAFSISSGIGYVRVWGFELRGGFDETVFLRAGAHDIDLWGLFIQGNHTGIWVGGAYRVTIRSSVLRRNFRTGVRIFAGAHDVQVIDSVSDGNDDGAGCEGDSDGFNADSTCRNILFDGDVAVNNSEDGFDLKASNVTLLGVTSQHNGCSGLKLYRSAYVENALIEGNRTGVNVAGQAGDQATITFSTFARNDLGVRAGGVRNTLVLTDSIVSGPGKALDYAVAVSLIEARNIFWRPNLRERLVVQETAAGEVLFSGADVNSGRWARVSGQGVGTIARDPALDANTCRPSSRSAAIDSAGSVGAPPVDHDGNPRPAGAGNDRGAFEYRSGS